MTTKINIVLLIDESTPTSSRLISMLEDINNSQVVLQAANYKEALKMMDDFNPDYVLIDIGLSTKSGMSLLDEIRLNHKGSRVVVITSLANRHYKEFCDHMGVNFFLDKTNEFELIPGVISEAALN